MTEELGEELFARAKEKWRKRKVEDALLETPDALLTADQLKEKRKVFAALPMRWLWLRCLLSSKTKLLCSGDMTTINR